MDGIEQVIKIKASIRAGLHNGIKHYDLQGNLLSTEEEILACLKSDGAIKFDRSEEVSLVSAEEMEKEIREE